MAGENLSRGWETSTYRGMLCNACTNSPPGGYDTGETMLCDTGFYRLGTGEEEEGEGEGRRRGGGGGRGRGGGRGLALCAHLESDFKRL